MKKDFSIPLVIEAKYVDLLDKVAQQVQLICRAHADNPTELANQLRNYSELVKPWAQLVAYDMLTYVQHDRAVIWRDLKPKPKGNRYLQQRAKNNHGGNIRPRSKRVDYFSQRAD